MALELINRLFNPLKVKIDLKEIQSIILRSRPIPYFGTLSLLSITDKIGAKSGLKELLPLIDNAQNWADEHPFTLWISFTYSGLAAIGLSQESLDTFPESFKTGMAGRAEFLHDKGINDPANWDPIYQHSSIHIIASLIASSEEEWKIKKAEIENKLIQKNGISILASYDFGVREEDKNVFGFRDGISNPEVAGSGIAEPPGFGSAIKAGEFILGYPGEGNIIKPFPLPDVLGRNGSFMVFRKYQSQVAAFNKFIQENTNSVEEGELLAAKMVGRWRSGAPLVLSPEKDDLLLGNNAQKNNNFSFKDDEFGKKCPYSSHIRRMNPRDSKSFVMEDMRLHRIIRKSVSYGDIVSPEITEDDGKERGLYFIGISANAMGTLEFLQKQWANDGNSKNLGEEKDPLIGVNEDGVFSMAAEPITIRYRGLSTFNIVKGGVYCFIPSLSALKWISEL